MDIDSQRDALLGAIQQQYQDNVAATEANRRLADEQISYNNEARGTYYSGIPTWQRAQNAATYGEKMNDLNKNLLSSQNSIWNTVSDYLDKITAYNEAGSGGSNKSNNNNNNGSTYKTDIADYYTSDKGYQFKDSKGNAIKLNTFAKNTSQNVWDLVGKMAKNGDVNAKRALAGYKNANKQLTAEERAAWAILGLDTSGYGSRD